MPRHRERHRRPEVTESAYEGCRCARSLSFIDDGLAPIAERYGELAMPLLLLTSREDHVVEPADSEYLAEHYGGSVDHRWLERSYHVATRTSTATWSTPRRRRSPQGHSDDVMAAASAGEHPEPVVGTLEIGPLSLNVYGLMIALGVIAAVWLLGRRLEEKGIGTREDANAIALWGVVAGVIGARLYHVLTDWERFQDDLGEIVKVWEGGLGIPGGMLAGVLVGG